MVTISALILSILLQLIAFFIAIRLIRVSRRRLAWVLLAIAFLFMGIRRSIELFGWLQQGDYTEIYTNLSYFIGIAVSILIALGVILLSNVLHSLKKTEQFRKAAEQRFRILFNSTSDFILVSDLNGDFVEVNENTCTVLGYSKTEMLTKNFNDIVTSRYLNKINKEVKNITLEGKLIFEAEYKSRDGDIIPVEINARQVVIHDVSFIICVARDITERQELRKKILKTIIETEEKERRRFAKDLHDGLGPLLSTIKLYINELESKDIEEKEKDDYIKYTSELIDEAVSNTRNISNNITPNIITNYGLVRSLDSFVGKVNKTQQFDIKFKAIGMEGKFDETIELIMYRIITELINNTIKHASAKNVLIVLELLNNKLILTYRDNGIGFNPREVLESEKAGMGLKNIISRISSINGHISINENTDKGTEVIIKVDVERPS
ncbi:MAG: PAS domain S-box protein [Bacteroidota bacterium]|nr:PAS domain S-box protein [Bacteroidota bacterium]